MGMMNTGTWTVSNDTIVFQDESLLHRKNKILVIKGRKLIDQDGRVYKRMNFLQRKFVYRGR